MLAFHTAAARVFSTSVAIGKPMSDLTLVQAVQEILWQMAKKNFCSDLYTHVGCYIAVANKPHAIDHPRTSRSPVMLRPAAFLAGVYEMVATDACTLRVSVIGLRPEPVFDMTATQAPKPPSLNVQLWLYISPIAE
jgi:hypothetical protein